MKPNEQRRVTYLADSVQESVLCIVHHFDIDFFTLHLFRGGDDAKNNPYVRTNYPDAWVSHYLLNDYVRIDPVLQKAKTTAEPFCWSTIVPKPDQMNMMEQAQKFGIGASGFTISHVDKIGRRSVLSFNTKNAPSSETWEAFIDEHREHLTSLAFEMHQMALSEDFGSYEHHPQLSPREMECLKWTAEGKAHTEIAIILNLSEHTVRSYLKEARLKLDSVTLAQAVSKASSLGLI